MFHVRALTMSHLIILLCGACSLTDGSLCTCSDDKVSVCEWVGVECCSTPLASHGVAVCFTLQTLVIYDWKNKTIRKQLMGHTKAVNRVVWSSGVLFTLTYSDSHSGLFFALYRLGPRKIPHLCSVHLVIYQSSSGDKTLVSVFRLCQKHTHSIYQALH